jgi:Undecaprenyl-phosphate glucose phosphotransferase
MKQKRPGLRIVGMFDDRRNRLTSRTAGSVRSVDDLLELGRRVNIDRVVLTLPLHAEARILEISDRLMALAVEILVCPDVTGFNLLRRPVMSQAGFPAIRIADRPISAEHFIIKVAEDKIIGFVMLLLMAPLLLAIAVAIKLGSPGPVLFRQLRHGYNNRVFEVLKFRTMRVESGDASGARQAQRNDSRVTRLGKFLRRTSLDELPQLFNVLRGDMSLVGPRPLPIGMRTQDLACHEIVQQYAHRHRVRPGITGWAQISGNRGATEHPVQLRKRVELDLFYIENWSLLFDLKILVLTGFKVVCSKNAF